MATTSPEPSSPSSLPSSSDGAAVGLAVALGDGAISVAAASETILFNWNEGNSRDGRDDGEIAAISIAAASGTAAAVTTSQQAVISSDAKSTMQAYFVEEE
jgi:hypothetical protein